MSTGQGRGLSGETERSTHSSSRLGRQVGDGLAAAGGYVDRDGDDLGISDSGRGRGEEGEDGHEGGEAHCLERLGWVRDKSFEVEVARERAVGGEKWIDGGGGAWAACYIDKILEMIIGAGSEHGT